MIRVLTISIACILIIPFSLFSQVPEYLPADSLVAWYPFNGNVNDESGNGNHAILEGATLTEDRNGNLNSAYLFNDDNPSHIDGKQDLITIPHNSQFDTEQMSISVWVKLIDFNTENGGIRSSVVVDRTGLLSYTQGDTTAANFQISLSPEPDFATDLNSLDLVNSLSIQAPNHFRSSLRSSESNVALGEWYHLVMTYDGQFHRMYLDSQLIDETEIEGKLNPNNEPILVGQRLQANGYYYHTEGVIDDIAFWSRGLTEN